jgi:hypothetical protein
VEWRSAALLWRIPPGLINENLNADFDPKKSDIGLKNTYKWISFP